MPSPQQTLSKPGSSTERVITAVLAQVADGTLNPGEQIRQEDLASSLGISRVPVREGLHSLAEEGILVHRKHRGFFVAKRTVSELAQLTRMVDLISREVLSTLDWPDHATLDALREINERMRSLADDDDITEMSRLNTAFHFAVYRLSRNHLMVDELERLWRLAHTYIVSAMLTPESRRQRVIEHEQIIASLAAHDTAGIIAAHTKHRNRGEELDDSPTTSKTDLGSAAVLFSSAP